MKSEENDFKGRKSYVLLDKIKIYETFSPGFSADILNESEKIISRTILRKPFNLWYDELAINKSQDISFLPEDIIIICIVYERDRNKRDEIFNKLRKLLMRQD